MKKQRIAQSLTALLLCLAGLQTFASPANAAALTDTSWSVSKAHPGDTNVRYTWSFTTSGAQTVTTMTFSVPAGTLGASLSVTDSYGVPTGTAALSGTTVTYTFSSTAIAAGTPVLVSLEGFTNPAATTAASTITVGTDSGPSNSVVFDSNTTLLTVVVARTITFTNNTDEIVLLMDPSIAALKTRTHSSTSLQIATNSRNGYTLSAMATPLADVLSSGTTIATATVGVGTGVADVPTNSWGFAVPPVTDGSLAANTLTRAAQLAAGNFVGHTGTNQTIATQTKPTNGDTIPVTTKAKIDYLQAALKYQSTITYTAAPSY